MAVAVWRMLVAIAGAASAWVWWLALRPGLPPSVTFLDVGQADAIVVETCRGGVWLVDAGTPGAARGVVVNWLRARGVNRLSGIVLTHGDADHAGGAPWLIERFRTGRLVVPCGIEESGAEAVATARKRGVPVVEVLAGDRMTWDGDVRVDVLHGAQCNQRSSEPDNTGSLIMRLRTAGAIVLLTGDADAAAENEAMASSADLRADLLKVAHHGSHTSTSHTWLERVRPRVAVISAGRGNRFGHPHPTTLERLKRSQTRVFRTDLDGHVRAEIDDGRLHVFTTSRRAVRPHD
ncbi:MAG TPA: ComEC/Rec2 family competence protein [Chthonomonadales bacterium]|nr:ComEC/Rec2 family competence protein [Chthonomonadales bacterium]